jgi:hypothetical protein
MQIIMMRLIAEGGNGEYTDMIAWYNAQIFDWFNRCGADKDDGSVSSGIDEVMNRMEDLDIQDPGMGPQGDDEDWGAEQYHPARALVCRYHLFLLFIV